MKLPLSPEAVEIFKNNAGDLAVPQQVEALDGRLLPAVAIRMDQVGDVNGDFPMDPTRLVLRYGLFMHWCEYGVVIALNLKLGPQERQTFVLLELAVQNAVDWLRTLCCLDELTLGIIDKELEVLSLPVMRWTQHDRLNLHDMLREGLQRLATIPASQLDSKRLVESFAKERTAKPVEPKRKLYNFMIVNPN
jgi:hypothetical protein